MIQMFNKINIVLKKYFIKKVKKAKANMCFNYQETKQNSNNQNQINILKHQSK